MCGWRMGTHTKPYATKQEINFVYPIGYNILQTDTMSILKRNAVCTIPYEVYISLYWGEEWLYVPWCLPHIVVNFLHVYI